MIKLKTTNTFLKGLISDPNPMTAGQDSLSSALNATFITNDGDDLMLLNDMGNTRLEHIKLNPGYAPVGMCTYGGVTYVASYNPKEQIGEIGSFPAPSEVVYDTNLGIETNSKTLNAANPTYSFALLDGAELRAGDKFDLYCDLYDKNGWSLGDYNSPITCTLCIVDNEGNLKDITSEIKKHTSNDSYVDVDSSNLFKAKTLSENIHEGDCTTIYGLTIPGKLYFTYKLNLLESYEIEAEFIKNSTTKEVDMGQISSDLENTKLAPNSLGCIFTVHYTYKYKDSINGLKLTVNGNNGLLPLNGGTENTSSEDGTKSYESTYYLALNNITSGLKTFTFIPDTKYGLLTKLLRTITVDIDKLNSGEINLNTWKYYVDDNSVTLNYGIEAYPYTGTRIDAIKVDFYNLYNISEAFNPANINPDYSFTMSGRKSYNGFFLKTLSFADLEESTIYLVLFKYKYSNSDEFKEFSHKTLLTTRLYNSLYFSDIDDFNTIKPSDSNSPNYYSLYHTILPELSVSPTLTSNKSKIIYPIIDALSTILTKLTDIDIEYSLEPDIKYIDLYPFGLELDGLTYKTKDKDWNLDSTSTIDTQEGFILRGTLTTNDTEIETAWNGNTALTSTLEGSKIHILGKKGSLYTGKVDQADKTYTNVIKLFDSKKLSGLNSTDPYLTAAIFAEHSGGIFGHRDKHGLYIIQASDKQDQYSNLIDLTKQLLDNTANGYENLYYRASDDDLHFYFTEFFNKFVETFPTLAISKCDFLYIKEPYGSVYRKDSSVTPADEPWGSASYHTVTNLRTSYTTRLAYYRQRANTSPTNHYILWRNGSNYTIVDVKSSNKEFTKTLPTTITRDDITSCLKNLFLYQDTESVSLKVNVFSSSEYRYTDTYLVTSLSNISITYNVKVNGATLNKSTKEITFATLGGNYSSLNDYLKFAVKTDPYKYTLNIKFNIPSAENIYELTLIQSNDNAYVLEYGGKLFFTCKGKELSSKFAYEIVDGAVYQYGELSEDNKYNANYLEIDPLQNTVYPNTDNLINVDKNELALCYKENSDYKTTLRLGTHISKILLRPSDVTLGSSEQTSNVPATQLDSEEYTDFELI